MVKATRAALATEEPKVERLKAQLNKLFQFPQDVQPHVDSVVSAIQEYQRYLKIGNMAKISVRDWMGPRVGKSLRQKSKMQLDLK